MGETPADPSATWTEVAEAVADLERLVVGDGVPDRPTDQAEGLRYLTRLLAAGIAVCVEGADPEHPRFVRMVDQTMRWGLDCPDALYLYATIRGERTYRIVGSRGSANLLDIQVNRGHFASGSFAHWSTVSSTSSDELDLGPGEDLEVVLGPDRVDGPWLRTEPGEEHFVLLRQYFDDWATEVPADLTIEPIDGPTPVPPPDPQQVARRLGRLVQWLGPGADHWEEFSRGLLAMPANTVAFVSGESSVGLRRQLYGIGNFRCGSDEAVILEWEPPTCRHWNVGLANWFWESLDFVSRQGSLNRSQSVRDDDGALRFVIAHRDPGVANWLDTIGHDAGSLAIRVLGAEGDVEPPQARVVPLEQVTDELPDAVRVTPDERAARLAARWRAAQRRYRR